MKTKKSINLLIGSLLIAGLVIGIGIVMAHGNGDKNDNEAEAMHSSMGEMHEMMESMMGSMNEQMMGNMDEMMEDEEFREEMLEHMKDCPMMKKNSSS